ncbi:MAG: hypothetical protein AAF632_09735 [Bacteroidota bacterium]
MPKPIISVYEQSRLRIGDRQNGIQVTDQHLRQLDCTRVKLPAGIFRLGYQSVQFGNWVGLIELPDIIIEILPKIADSENIGQTRTRWTHLLQQFDFLPQLGNLNPQLLMQPGNLTETLQRAFLVEVTRLVQRGLIKQYQSQRSQQPFLRGRLLFPEQIRTNLVQKHRFFVQAQCLAKDHRLNQRLKQALRIVATSGNYSSQTQDLLRYFRSVDDIPLDKPESRLKLNRVTQHYQTSLRLANLICNGYLGGTFAGQDFGFSLLFDMSRVFERLVYFHLRKLSQGHHFTVFYQPQRSFWQQKQLRPDFILQLPNNQSIVIDTKWKILNAPEPSDEDLRQIFAYTQVFRAQRGILLYPQTSDLQPTQQSFGSTSQSVSVGEIRFLSILENVKAQLLEIILG